MTSLSPRQLARLAYEAGFRDGQIVVAVAVALAESGGNPRAVGVNADRWRSRDRGLWQINDHWHPEVSDAVAFSPKGNAGAAYRISGSGTNWSPWSTYKTGSYRAHMGRARMATAAEIGYSGAAPTAPGVTGVPTTPQQGSPSKAPRGGTSSTASAAGWWTPVPGLPGLPLDLLTDPKVIQDGAGMFALAAHAAGWISDPHNWARVAMVAGGSVGVLLGVSMLARSGAMGSTAAAVSAIPGKAASVAASVVPIGKAAKAVTKAS